MLKLDPIGYFLIKAEPKTGTVGIAFCRYQQKKGWYSNQVDDEIHSDNIDEIINWIKENNYTSMPSHLHYMRREVGRAFACMIEGKEFIQDGATVENINKKIKGK